MNIEKTKEILLGRIDKLTDTEKEWMYNNNRGWYNRYLFDYTDQDVPVDVVWKSLWLYSAFGQHYLHNQSLAKKFLSSEKKMNHVMDMMEDRKTWYSSGTQTMKELHAEGKLTQEVVGFMINNMRKNNLNVFEGYVREPIFDTGAIVQFRSNIGVDAILQENNWGSGKNYYGADRHTLRQLKGKTMMVLGESPTLGGKVYATSYAYKEKQGGSRYYRVLPVGDTQVYVVVEKFLKKCRTKAVKDAKK